MAKVAFDLVSPENLIFSDEVGMIIIPGKDGDLGILPGHSKVMSSLRPGRVIVFGEDKNLLKSFFVSGGFAEINPEKCIVLAESVVELNSLEKSSIEKEIQELENIDNQKSVEKIFIAKAKLEALESKFYEKI
jgi:F-type H+-transporting ATPase subunit epsilon